MRLHTANCVDVIDSCLRGVAPGDCLLLIEDGVYAGCMGASSPATNAACKILALEADVAARGLLGKLDRRVELVDYEGFVALAAACESVASWY